MFFWLSVRIAAKAHASAQARLPTNILLRYVRTRRGLKWAIPVALILVPTYLFAAALATAMIEDGGPGWLNLNEVNDRAVLVTREGTRLGYVPDPLLEFIHPIMHQEHALTVLRVNKPEAGLHMRLLVMLRGTLDA